MPREKLKLKPKANLNKENKYDYGSGVADEGVTVGNTSQGSANYSNCSWSSQDLLTSTHTSSSLTANSARMSITQRPKVKNRKTKKKVKQQFYNRVEFSSDDDAGDSMSANSSDDRHNPTRQHHLARSDRVRRQDIQQHLTGISHGTPQSTPSLPGSDEPPVIFHSSLTKKQSNPLSSKQKLIHMQKESEDSSSGMGLPTERGTCNRPAQPSSTPKKLKPNLGYAHVERDAEQGCTAEKSTPYLDKSQPRSNFGEVLSQKHLSVLKKIQILWDSTHEGSSIGQEVSYSSHPDISSSMSSQNSETSLKTKPSKKLKAGTMTKNAGKHPKKAVVSKKSIFTSIAFSSESDNSDIEHLTSGKGILAQKSLAKVLSDKNAASIHQGHRDLEASIPRQSHGETQKMEKEKHLQGVLGNSEIVTIPCTQTEPEIDPYNYAPCTETMDSTESYDYGQQNDNDVEVVPCSQTLDNPDVLVPESESIEDDPAVLGPTIMGENELVVPCSQQDAPNQERSSFNESSEIWCDSTQGLVDNMVTILKATSQHSHDTRVQEPNQAADNPSVKSSESEIHLRHSMAKGKPNPNRSPKHNSSSSRKKFFEFLPVSDEDISPKSNKQTSASVHSRCDDSEYKEQAKEFSERLQNILSKSSKKKPGKGMNKKAGKTKKSTHEDTVASINLNEQGEALNTPATKSSNQCPKLRQEQKLLDNPSSSNLTGPSSSLKGKKFFELLHFSDEETEMQEANPLGSVSVNRTHARSNCQTQSERNDTCAELSQRLQNILSSCKKKKPHKGTKNICKKKKSVKKGALNDLYSLLSEDSSFEKGSEASRDGSSISVLTNKQDKTSHSDSLSTDQSIVPDSMIDSVLVTDTESADADVGAHLPEISIPDSQTIERNLDLQLSVTSSTQPSTYDTQQTTVRHISPQVKEMSLQVSMVSEDDEYSPVIPFMPDQVMAPVASKGNNQKRHEQSGTMQQSLNGQRLSASSEDGAEMRNISLQVSLGSIESKNNDHEDDSLQSSMASLHISGCQSFTRAMTSPNDLPVLCKDMSLQVSFASSQSDCQSEKSDEAVVSQSMSLNRDGEMNRTVFHTPPETRSDRDESPEENGPSPAVQSLSSQVSVSSKQSSRVRYEAISIEDSYGEESSTFAMPEVVRNLNDSLEDEEEGESEEEVNGTSGPSLQVSMCIENVSGESDESDDNAEVDLPKQHSPGLRERNSSGHQSGSDGDLSDGPVATGRRGCTRKRNRPVILSDSESDEHVEDIDDSDADPDFEVSAKKKQSVKQRGRCNSVTPAKSKNNAKTTPADHYVEAQAIRAVLLCEKRESVKRYSSDLEDYDDDDDGFLPDLTPSPRQNQPVFDSSDEESTRRRNVRSTKRKGRKSMDDFIVDDDDMTSEEEEDSHLFYIRTSKEFAATRKHRIASDGPDEVFKTPKPARSHNFNQRPVEPKLTSKTPAPERIRHAFSEKTISNSTGHVPHFEGFLRSLSASLPDQQRHPEAKRFVKEFKKRREDLTQKLFKMYNETVFDNQLPADLPIQWNSRLTSTAGFCAYKRDKQVPSGRITRVELSVKVCDSAERVRDTLIHEMCHAAVWLIYGKNDGHGHYWRALARKAMRVHADLPSISRCHMYDIHHKYIYKCCKCGQQIGRHTKSLKTDQKICGICHGKFEVMLNTSKGLTAETQRTPRTPNKFALFVKENYANIKKRDASLKHADVMKALSAEFAAKNKI